MIAVGVLVWLVFLILSFGLIIDDLEAEDRMLRRRVLMFMFSAFALVFGIIPFSFLFLSSANVVTEATFLYDPSGIYWTLRLVVGFVFTVYSFAAILGFALDKF